MSPEVIFIIVIILFSLTIYLFLKQVRAKKKRIQDIRSQWGQEKHEYRDFSFIRIYCDLLIKNNKEAQDFVLDDQSWQDLNLDEIFSKLDTCSSKPGQQFLFQLLRMPKAFQVNPEIFDATIEFVNKNPEIRENCQYLFGQLNNRKAYFLPYLFLQELASKPKWFFIIPMLSITSLALIIGIFFNPACFIFLLFILIINAVIHYINKRKLSAYIDSFVELNNLLKVSKKITEFTFPGINNNTIRKSVNKLTPLKMNFLLIGKEESTTSGDELVATLVWIIKEYLKITFLLELIAFYSSLKQIRKANREIQFLFESLGYIDSAIAIASFRKSLPYYCKPQFIDSSEKRMEMSGLFHPLVPGCIPNNLKVEGKSILITGSNMSGKTTFIRTVGLNALLAQTIFTCTAEEFIIPANLKIYTSIEISDNLMEGKSYYLEEVESLHKMVKASRQQQQNLFIIDEVLKGTNTIERIAAADAILSFLDNSKSIVFVSTHDVELTEILKNQYKLFHFSETVSSNGFFFDHKIKPGPLTIRNAIKLLEISGYPKEIIDKANQNLKK